MDLSGHNCFPANWLWRVGLWAFKQVPENDSPDGDNSTEAIEKPRDERQFEAWLVCANCAHPVTRNQYRISIKDSHEHRFINPQNIVFNIRCFNQAPGCVGYGEFTDEFSWFPGYQWQISLCANCYNHLGWKYSSSDHGFYGLISDRITELDIEIPANGD